MWPRNQDNGARVWWHDIAAPSHVGGIRQGHASLSMYKGGEQRTWRVGYM